MTKNGWANSRYHGWLFGTPWRSLPRHCNVTSLNFWANGINKSPKSRYKITPKPCAYSTGNKCVQCTADCGESHRLYVESQIAIKKSHVYSDLKYNIYISHVGIKCKTCLSETRSMQICNTRELSVLTHWGRNKMAANFLVPFPVRRLTISGYICQHRPGPTLARVVAGCQTAPSHYLTLLTHQYGPVVFIWGYYH